MRKQILNLSLILIIALLMAGAASAVPTTTSAPNIYVSTTGNDANDGLTPETAVQSINVGITKVDENGVVNLAPGTYNKTGDPSKDIGITISKSLTLAGAGKDNTFIDGLGISQIFYIEWGYSVIIKDITFQNAYSENGGAIRNDGPLTVKNCAFINNKAVAVEGSSHGGAIYANSALQVINCLFTGNQADTGGAIANNGGFINITGSNFLNNKANAPELFEQGGGAIYTIFGSYYIVGNNILNNLGSGIKIDTPFTQPSNFAAGAPYNFINFNRFFGNSVYAIYLQPFQPNIIEDGAANGEGYRVNATNNWWGTNSNPKLNPNNIGGDIAQVLADPWLILTIIANPTNVPFGATSQITASLTTNSNGEDTSSLGHVPDGIPITITTDIGNVGSKSVTKYTFNGIATAILRANEGYGTASLYAILDGFQTPLPANVVIAQAANTVQAGTIGMQNTGTPLAGLVLALLLVIGGLFTTRKK